MTSQPTIFTDEPTVRISQEEYERLLEYKAICKEIYSRFGGELDGL